MFKKFPLQIILTTLIFLIINTSYFWESELGILFMFVIILVFIIFFILSIELVRQLYISAKNNFSEKSRNILLIFMISCLVLIVVKPIGIINFENLEGENRIVAQAEGVANCTATLKLKTNEKFIYEDICFGIDRIKGEYKITNDTIHFKKSRKSFQYKYGVINKNAIYLYKNKSDKNSYALSIKPL